MSQPERQWEEYMVRVRDLAVRGFWLARRCKENGGVGESTFSHEQYMAAFALCEEMTAFLKARVAAAREPAAQPAQTNGANHARR